MLVTANGIASGNKLSLQNAGDNMANQWALFKSNQPGANKELYDLKPGIYRIVSLADEEKAVTTRDNAWASTTDILIGAKIAPNIRHIIGLLIMKEIRMGIQSWMERTLFNYSLRISYIGIRNLMRCLILLSWSYII